VGLSRFRSPGVGVLNSFERGFLSLFPVHMLETISVLMGLGLDLTQLPVEVLTDDKSVPNPEEKL
jgi:hypothetical protein